MIVKIIVGGWVVSLFFERQCTAVLACYRLIAAESHVDMERSHSVFNEVRMS